MLGGHYVLDCLPGPLVTVGAVQGLDYGERLESAAGLPFSVTLRAATKSSRSACVTMLIACAPLWTNVFPSGNG